MITENFLNLCFAVLSDENPKFSEQIVSDIYEVLAFYKEKEDDIPLQCKQKFGLLFTLSKLRKNEKTIDEALESILIAGQFGDQENFIHSLSTPQTNIPEKKVDVALKRLWDRKKLISMARDLPKIEKTIEKFNTNAFPDTDVAIKEYDSMITRMYSRLSEEKRLESQTSIKSLDMMLDDYGPALDQIELSYSGKNSVTTGYPELDDIMNGGFEPSRLYVFGGASGDGKSVLLLNCAKNGVERKRNPNERELKEIYLYVTLENLIDESLIRLFCCKDDKTIKQIIENYSTVRPIIERDMKEWQINNNAALVMAYFPPTITSVADILMYIEEIKNRYKGEAVIKAVYIDYLDLLKSGQQFDLHRLEMGQITIDLKVLAVRLQIPIVTVTQVNRLGYDHKEHMSLVHMSESIKKVEHSDFVGLIRSFIETNEEGKIITDIGDLCINIGKNRSGPKNKQIHLATKFQKFQIKSKMDHGTTHVDFSIRTPQNTNTVENIMPENDFDITV